MPVTDLPDLFYGNIRRYDLKTGRTTQPPPFGEPTSFTHRVRTIVSQFGGRGYGKWTADTNVYFESPFSRERQFAYNKAYERFMSKLGDKSSFGATITAERRETFSMITGFAISMLEGAQAAKRRDILGVFKALHFYPPIVRVKTKRRRKRGRPVYSYNDHYVLPDGRKVAKDSASAWLLYSYGISPLLNDIQNATDVFIRSTPNDISVRGRARETLSSSSIRHDANLLHVDKVEGVVYVGITSRVGVENYDLWLLNQLGLVNPVQFVNEAIPFSFVIDWFSNWSSVIGALTDRFGLIFRSSCTSTKYVVKQDFQSLDTAIPPVPWYESNGVVTDCVLFTRTLGFTPPKLMFRYERFEWRRALNAISLLIGIMPKHNPKS